jgi:hypothetical protein
LFAFDQKSRFSSSNTPLVPLDFEPKSSNTFAILLILGFSLGFPFRLLPLQAQRLEHTNMNRLAEQVG